MSLEQPQPARRASDKDRDRAANLVQEAHSDGRLDVEELDERLTRIYSAKTAVELRTATADLLPEEHGSKSAVLTIRAKGSSQKRQGSWQVPEHLNAVAEHSSLHLDFTDAVVRWPEIHVDAQAKHSSVVLVVPEGWSVDLDDVDLQYSSSQNKAGAAGTAGVRLHITGQVKHSSIVVRHPRKRRWWWPWYRK